MRGPAHETLERYCHFCALSKGVSEALHRSRTSKSAVGLNTEIILRQLLVSLYDERLDHHIANDDVINEQMMSLKDR